MAAKQLMLPANRAFDSNGFPEAGATVKLYESGTTTPANFYADSALTNSLGSTVTANAAGRFVTPVYQDSTTPFRIKIFDVDGNELDDIDPYYFGSMYGYSVIGTGSTTAANRTALAGLSTTLGSVYLQEDKREGTFVFDSSNLSTRVTEDTQQGIYVPPVTDPTGTNGAWVRQHDGNHDPHWFGAVGDGITDDLAAIQATINHVNSIGGGTVRLTPGKTFKISASLSMQNMIDVEINAHGATITSAMTTSGPMVTLYDASGKRCHIRGGLWKLTSGSANPWFFSFAVPNCTLEDAHCIKTPDAGGYQMYVFNTAPGFKAIGNRFEGSNGFYIECSDALFVGNSLIGQAVGGDDAFAVKAVNSSSRNLRFIGNYIEALSAGLSIGSEIGVLGANDATYSRTVGQIIYEGNALVNCVMLAYIKPGGISAYDYRDGTVEDVLISNNTLTDLSGSKFARGIAITPSRGARVRGVRGRNNIIRARSYDDGTGGRRMGALDIYEPGYGTGTANTNVSDIDVQVDYSDPLDGAVGAAAPAPAPVANIVAMEAAAGNFTLSNITLDIVGNGSNLSGIFIGAGFDDAVTIRRAVLTNVNTNGSATFGGIRAASRIQVSTDISISAAIPYVIDSTGKILCPEMEEQIYLFSQVNAGNADTQYPWRAKRRCLLVEILLGTTLSVAASNTNYTSLTIRNLGGTTNVFNTAETKVSGSTGVENPLFSLTAQQFSTIFQYRTNLSNQSLFSLGSVLMFSKADTGAGATLQNARLVIRALPY